MPSTDLPSAAAWPVVSLAEAHDRLTAPGAPFEMEALEIDGQVVRAWKHGPKTLAEVFEAASAFGEAAFLVSGEERVSFAAFRRATFVFAAELSRRGVGPGERVAIAMRNLPEWPVAFYAAALIGAVPTPLNGWWSAQEMVFGLKDSGATVLVADAERLDRLAGVLPDLSLETVYVCRGPAPAPGTLALEAVIGPPQSWAQLTAGEPPAHAVQPEDFATLFYTSGTTGEPKGVPASHRAVTTPIMNAMFSQARALLRRGQLPPQPEPARQGGYVVCIPFFHVTGCFALLNTAMVAGMKLVLMRRFEPEAAMRLVQAERATAIGGVPTIPWTLLHHPARGGYDLSSLQAVTYGGAPAASDLVRRIGEAWPHAAAGTGWGMTETCSTFTHHMGEDYALRPLSCGPAAPVGDMRIVDAAGQDVATGEVGELWVRGPDVVRGYWNRPAATEASFVDGWLRTGDLARLDDEGFCYMVDRLKDVILRGGENIYCAQIEDVLMGHPAVAEAAVAAIAHPALGEEPGAIVVLHAGARASEAELKTHVAARLAAYKTPVRILFREAPLPRNENGKLLRAELRRALAGEPA